MLFNFSLFFLMNHSIPHTFTMSIFLVNHKVSHLIFPYIYTPTTHLHIVLFLWMILSPTHTMPSWLIIYVISFFLIGIHLPSLPLTNTYPHTKCPSLIIMFPISFCLIVLHAHTQNITLKVLTCKHINGDLCPKLISIKKSARKINKIWKFWITSWEMSIPVPSIPCSWLCLPFKLVFFTCKKNTYH